MKRMFLVGAVAAAVLGAPPLFAAPKMVCKDTGKETGANCCCTVKAGKFVCSYSKKTHDTCCCESKKS